MDCSFIATRGKETSGYRGMFTMLAILLLFTLYNASINVIYSPFYAVIKIISN
jgi:hypothetical protein